MRKITYVYLVVAKFCARTKPVLISMVLLFILFTYTNVFATWSDNVYGKMSSYFLPVTVPCNTDLPVPITNLNYTDLVATSNTTGLCLPIVCGIQGVSNLVDANETNFASAITALGVGVTHTFRVTDNTLSEYYNSGNYAGFLIENSSVVQADLLSAIVVRTFLDGVEQESNTSTSLAVVNSTLLASGKYYVGFHTTKDFDAIEISISSLVGIASTTRIYHAVTSSLCTGPTLECNTPTMLAKPNFPARIVEEHTGMGGLLTLGSVANAIEAIDSDSNTYASINLNVGIAGSGSLAIKDEFTDYVANTYVGFDIENASVLNLDLLNGITLRTYLDGTLQESKTGSSELLSVDSGLLFTGTERSQVGFVTTLPFDEVQISIQQTVSLDLGSTRVYGLVLEAFCEGSLECSTATLLSNPSQPVIINNSRTGVDGLVCVGCEVDNATNVISESNTDFASINVVAGVANTASVSVENVLGSFPAGSNAGFVIRDTNDLLEVDLLNSLTVTTYLNGAVQEFKTAANLLALEALGLISITPTSSDGFYLIGFPTTLEYDEVRLTVASLVGVINSIEVYGSYVDASIKIEGTVINETAVSASDGSLSVAASGGIPPYSYLWSPGGQTSSSINSLSPGTYSVTVTDSKGCNATAEFIIYTDGVQYPVPCNTDAPVAITAAGFTDLSINESTTGVCVVGCGIQNEDNIIDANPNNYATVATLVGLGITHTLTVTDGTSGEFFTAGGYAGFLVENNSVVQADLLNAIVVRTYLDGVLQEVSGSGTLVAINSALLGTDQYYVGFYTTMDYDAIEISISSLAGVLSTTNIYHAVTNSFCAGPDLACNTATQITKSDFPVRIVEEHTGTGGLLGVGSVANANNAIDSNENNYASINLLAGVAANASLAIKDELAEYPANTFAGFDIENSTILNTELFDAITISTYLDGVFVESKTGTTELLPVNSGLLLTGSESVRVGFVSTAPFDEVQITLSQLVSLNLGSTRVYGMVLQSFCEGIINCDASYVPSNPDDSVIINNSRTGVDGLACVACEVDDSQNVITENNTDYAMMNVVAGVAGTASISVKDVLVDYPAATFAGFVIRDTNNLLQVDLLNSLTITTYLDDVQQEQQTSGSLLALDALGLISITPTSTTGFYVVGFDTSMAFDEVRITVASLLGVLNSIEVYGEYIDARNSGFCQTADIALIKTAVVNDEDANGCSDAGETITYTFTVSNEGNTSITNVVITDPMLTGAIALTSGDTDSDNQLDVNETWVYTSNYTITQDNIDAGLVSNQATVTGTSTGGMAVSDLSDDNSVLEDDATKTTLCRTQAIAIIKQASLNDENSNGCSEDGETISFIFTVSNQGNTSLSTVTVTDPLLTDPIVYNSGDTDADGKLDVDELWIFSGTYNITQPNVDAGIVVNQATAEAISPSGITVTDLSDDNSVLEDDILTVSLCQAPAIAVINIGVFNDENSNGCSDVGETITYTITVTNQGNTGLLNVSVTDALLGGSLTLSSGDLDSNNILSLGEMWRYSGNYTITQADINTGFVTNQATAEGTSLLGVIVSDVSDESSILENDATQTTLCQSSEIALIKTASFNDLDNDGCSNVGETITYSFEVTNQGNLSIASVILTDAFLGGTIALASGDTDSDNELDITETWMYTANYTITQANIDAGLVSNQATVTGIGTSGVNVSDLSDNDSVLENDATQTILCRSANIALVKTGVFNDENTDGCSNVGETITYTFNVTNTGNSSIANVVLTDTMLGGAIALASGDIDSDNQLDVTETWVYTSNYAITQTDIDLGVVSNQAVVAGVGTNGVNVSDLSDDNSALEDDITETTLCIPNAISLEKVGVFNDENMDGSVQVGETITYSFTIYNTGETILYNITLQDDLPGVVINGGSILQLLPGDVDSTTFTATYTITAQDISNGMVTNQAVVVAEDILGNPVTDTSDDPTNLDDIDINNDGEPDDSTVTILLLVTNPDFEIFNAMSPDQDGLNDFFRIEGIEKYPDNNLKIYNRWGVLVYETDAYGINGKVFRGMSNGRVTVAKNEALPTGTYFYILTRLVINQDPLVDKGYLYIKRN
ncbi:gliding motility-associated C-terminal domain-containing protein [Mariniflexile gromovii]|uniref:Gliding motility-associated C-terminal domain-containing protein n=1 Tax=Mariniflexile gromovii TaxID=362523 RepID=A0ABS4BWZ8_9FLAO|nr:gliding motility-associated C-terminal domain-containing protein [Mariniflexile gromovii]MBP0905118.1 gliding motility-associated C-terminal domain-containing protein [Mariniflexile gromovii]